MRIKSMSWRHPALLMATLPLLTVLVLFFLIPFGMTLLLSFQVTKYYQVAWSWDLTTWKDVFSHSYYWIIMARTLKMALICVVLCVALGLPVAYALVNRLPSMENHVKILIVFAFLADAILKTFGWVLFFDRSGVLNGFLEVLGLGPAASDILFTPTAAMIGMVYNLLPYTIFTIYLSMVRIDRDLIAASYDSGASKLRTFWEITLPLSKPGLLAGAILVFVLGLGVFLEPKIMGGGTSPQAAELIRQTFETRVNWPLGAALTLVVIGIGTLTLMFFGFLFAKATKSQENAQ
jgi:spermidine/putrescine transport system permease protein